MCARACVKEAKQARGLVNPTAQRQSLQAGAFCYRAARGRQTLTLRWAAVLEALNPREPFRVANPNWKTSASTSQFTESQSSSDQPGAEQNGLE
jgi:hypothetical protein